jgi:RHS repeat-associated protein
MIPRDTLCMFRASLSLTPAFRACWCISCLGVTRFRKARCSPNRPNLLQNQCPPATPRTCREGPFGEVLRATGPMARANPFRFSTKYQDDETDLLYYGYRSYNASTGRWSSRDPIQERGGQNMYAFVGNDAVRRHDYLGMTVHLSPLNGRVYNFSRKETVTIRGDWKELTMLHGGDASEYVIYPWSYWDYWKAVWDPPPGDHNMRDDDQVGTYNLPPGHNTPSDWQRGSTRIVDADFITGATTAFFFNGPDCMTFATLPIKIGAATVFVRDCKGWCGIYYE